MNNPFANNIKKPNENNAKKTKPNLSINNRYATDLSLDSSTSNPDNKPKYKVPVKIPPKKESPVEIKEEDNPHKEPVNALFEDNKQPIDVNDIFNQGNKEEKPIEEVNTNTEVLIEKNGNEENNEHIEHIKEEDNNNQIASMSNDSKEAKSIINEDEQEVNEVKDANGHEEQNTHEVINNIKEEDNKEKIEEHYIIDNKSNEEEIIKLKKEIISLNNQLRLAKGKESSLDAECNQYKNQIKSQSEIISKYKFKEISESKYTIEIDILKSAISNKDTEINLLSKENSTLTQHLQSLSSFIKDYIEQRENDKENEEEEQIEETFPNKEITNQIQSDTPVHEIKENNVVSEQPKEIIENHEEVKQEPIIEKPAEIQKEVPKPKFKPNVINPPKTSLDDFLSNVESESVDNIFSKDDKDPLSKSLFD